MKRPWHCHDHQTPVQWPDWQDPRCLQGHRRPPALTSPSPRLAASVRHLPVSRPRQLKMGQLLLEPLPEPWQQEAATAVPSATCARRICSLSAAACREMPLSRPHAPGRHSQVEPHETTGRRSAGGAGSAVPGPCAVAAGRGAEGDGRAGCSMGEGALWRGWGPLEAVAGRRHAPLAGWRGWQCPRLQACAAPEALAGYPAKRDRGTLESVSPSVRAWAAVHSAEARALGREGLARRPLLGALRHGDPSLSHREASPQDPERQDQCWVGLGLEPERVADSLRP